MLVGIALARCWRRAVRAETSTGPPSAWPRGRRPWLLPLAAALAGKDYVSSAICCPPWYRLRSRRDRVRHERHAAVGARFCDQLYASTGWLSTSTSPRAQPAATGLLRAFSQQARGRPGSARAIVTWRLAAEPSLLPQRPCAAHITAAVERINEASIVGKPTSRRKARHPAGLPFPRQGVCGFDHPPLPRYRAPQPDTLWFHDPPLPCRLGSEATGRGPRRHRRGALQAPITATHRTPLSPSGGGMSGPQSLHHTGSASPPGAPPTWGQLLKFGLVGVSGYLINLVNLRRLVRQPRRLIMRSPRSAPSPSR